MPFLPVSKEEMLSGGVTQPDFVVVTGDAYVDHPSFGAAIISRLLEREGYSVCVLAQPDYNDLASFARFGKPALAFLVTSGNIDSMVNHYTAAKKKRSNDLYSPGGIAGRRPDRASIVYSQKIRAVYKDAAIILGGIEASLRRLSHYDYWDDKVRRSVLQDSGADIVIYGMGERSVLEVAKQLKSGKCISSVTGVRGTAYRTKEIGGFRRDALVILPGYNEICRDKRLFAESFMLQYKNTEPKTAKILAEKYDEGYVIQNPPMEPVSREEMDSIYALPYMRDFHPSYAEAGGVPAITEVKFSLTSVRGCFGACNFCALGFHQGRAVISRSHESLVAEAVGMTSCADFKGYIHDVGGPTANFRNAACEKQRKLGVCTDKKCLFPKPCKQLNISHKDYSALLDKLKAIPKVKKVFIRSGIRFDYLMADSDRSFFKKLCKDHISGQLKVAPEHISDEVLRKMGKPPKEVFEKFRDTFYNISNALGLKQFLVPYLMSGHPGSTLESAIELAEYLKRWGYTPEQVQDFYPTPSTISTCMYYTELDPFTMAPLYVVKNPKEKAMQRALIQYGLPQNYDLVYAALKKADRLDLVGYGKNCLIRPRNSINKNPVQKKPVIERKKKTIRNVHKRKVK